MTARGRVTRGTGARPALPLALLLAACLAWTSGCDEDCVTGVCPDRVPAGTIRGQVDVGPMPFAGRVRVQAADLPRSSAYTMVTPIDSDGAFGLELPYGSYTLRIELACAGESYFYPRVHYWRGEDQWVIESSQRDTLVLDEERPLVELDLVMGSLEVLVHAPQELEGCSIGLVPTHTSLPQPSYTYLHWSSTSAEVAGGTARFELPGFLPGDCYLRMSIGDGIPGREIFYLPGTRNPEQAATFTVEPGLVTHCETDLGAPAALLSGSVRGSWQLLDLAFPTVTLYTLDSTFVADRRCSQTGSFSLHLYRPEPVKLGVEIDGVTSWIGGGCFSEAEVFALQPGSVVTVPELVESGILVRLDLSDYMNDSTLRLVIHDAATLEHVLTTPVNMSTSAFLACANLRPGSYRVLIDNAYLQSSLVSQWFDRATDIHSATVVTISGDGQVAEIRADLEPGGEIRGHVLSQDDPCPIAVFYIVDAHTGICLGRAGCLPGDCMCICANPLPFRARGVPDGEYKVGVVLDHASYSEDPPPDTVWYPGTTSWDEAEIVRVENQATVTGIEINTPE